MSKSKEMFGDMFAEPITEAQLMRLNTGTVSQRETRKVCKDSEKSKTAKKYDKSIWRCC